MSENLLHSNGMILSLPTRPDDCESPSRELGYYGNLPGHAPSSDFQHELA